MIDLAVNGNRLWDSLSTMAKIGATATGGVERPAGSVEDGEARALLWRWCRDAGCELRLDGVGNMFARRPGQNK